MWSYSIHMEALTRATKQRRLRPFRFRFGLCTFLFSILVFGLILGRWIDLAREQKELVDEIRSLGGYAGYDDSKIRDKNRGIGDGNSERDKNSRENESAGSWLAKLTFGLEGDLFSNVTTINLMFADKTRVDRKLLARIGQLKHLKWLDLGMENRLTDDDLAPLAGLTQLEHLELSGLASYGDSLKYIANCRKLRELTIGLGSLRDEHLSYIAQLTSLRDLNLRGLALTDAGLAYLTELKDLEVLSIGPSSINGTGLAYIANHSRLNALLIDKSPVSTIEAISHMTSLRRLEVSHAMLGDKSLVSLGSLADLERIEFSYNQISDDGIESLSGLTKLRLIRLSFTNITDKSLNVFVGLPQLEEVIAIGSHITEDGVMRTKKINPKIQFDY